MNLRCRVAQVVGRQGSLWNTAGLGESFLDCSLQYFFLGEGAPSAVKTRKAKTQSADFSFIYLFI